MVQPINYSMDVLNPIQGYLQGLKFGEGLNTDRLNQEATTQSMGIQREQMDLQLRQYEDAQRARAQAQAAARAQAAAAQRQAVAGRDALLGYLSKLEDGTATPADLRRGIAENPQLADQFQAFASSVSEERLNNELGFGRQLSFALANENTEAAENLLRTRQEAAQASGDERTAAGYQAQLMQLQENPKGLLMQTLMPMAATLETDEFDSFYNDILGLGGGTAAPQSSIGKLQSDLRAGLISQEEYEVALQNMAPSGMALEVGPDGGISFAQGAGVGGAGAGSVRSSAAPTGQVAIPDPDSPAGVRLVDVPGGPTEAERIADEERTARRRDQVARAGGTVVQDLQRALDLLPELGALSSGEGVVGGIARTQSARVPGTVANRITQFTESALSNVGLDVLQQMRENSPTGGALGQVPIQQQTRLEQVLGSLQINQPPKVLDANIKRVMNIYTDIIHGGPDERARLVASGQMTPEENAEIESFYYPLPFDERGRPVDPSGAGSTSVTRLRFNPETGEFE